MSRKIIIDPQFVEHLMLKDVGALERLISDSKIDCTVNFHGYKCKMERVFSDWEPLLRFDLDKKKQIILTKALLLFEVGIVIDQL